MKYQRVNEITELLQQHWVEDTDLNLMRFLQKIADEAGFDRPLSELPDEVLIYQLKMRSSSKDEVIPGIKKDYEDDFKTALLKARGIIK